MTVNEQKLMDFVHRFVGDLGAAVAAGHIVIGDRLGLYQALATGAALPEELAERTGTAPRYVEEWLRGQAAGGYVEYDPADGRYSLTEEQAFALTDPNGPIFAPGAFQLALGALRAQDRVERAFRTGEGLSWGSHDEDVHAGCERFFRPGYSAHLIAEWLPALDGILPRLGDGIRVADVGCGHGASTVLMAQAYPGSSFTGYDCHTASIEQARKRASDAGLDGRVGFEASSAQDFGGGPYDLITTFDALHDMGDPLAAARNVRSRLTGDGTWMIVEPAAGETVADNLNPVGRVYYSFSAYLCVPGALAQEGGWSLGAQAGEEPIRRLVTEAGFTRFRRVAQTPFNHVYEARP
ncbi:class I SAM-dependent methyltransferase [Actinoplanes rectilineatus]|uniref:class I SAM-dependent methyltransferase n=1 Tax=Actinoplanes rectilineatus TaxID=113571 RepID=UPI0005F2BCFD|nr:class I SAM-dependent methyltransferase [Actinoplanes rectilineatus]